MVMIYYILQPFHEQAIAIAKFIKKDVENRLIAVLLDTEQYNHLHLYDETIVVSNYSQIPKENGYIIPTGAQSTEKMLSSGDLQLNYIKMAQKNLLVFDKIYFLDHCRKNNLPVPKQFDYKELTELSFPIFFKEKCEKGGGVRGRADSFIDLINVSKEDLIFQELIDSAGTYGVAFLAKEGKVITSFSHYEIESYPISGGSATVIKATQNSRLEELTENFVQSFGYDGWGLAEYKYCPRRKDFVFMEVNAKFWASCYFSFKNNPLFLRNLFRIDGEKEPIETLIFINRLLNTGFINTCRLLLKYRKSNIVVESSIFRSLCRAVLIDLKLR
ncbi:hypothetical protein LF296_18055 [Acinetobacter vivianii]|uniref:ATP-grasp domain-containing protein n=1 Tax=Acinetobacter vivianii TaxID=1776742 RepID=A0AAJ6P583_9GAMM|nr:hypothetical protein [Acinetobacter vivianii]WDZ51160.1 hypothetical protein LF296_18055 [Acinetobacter vivianii]